jgi:C1A family cysteine protease
MVQDKWYVEGSEARLRVYSDMSSEMESGFRPDDNFVYKFNGMRSFKERFLHRTSDSSDLREFASPRHNQSHSGSCVAQSVVKALELKRIQSFGINSHVDLSRLAVYYLAREMMKPSEINQDRGTHISLAAEVLKKFGVCEEKIWPFDLTKLFTPPPWSAMRRAFLHKISEHYRIDSSGNDRIQDVIFALSNDCPVVFGTKIDSSWQKYTGKDPISVIKEKSIGGHATVLEGWDPNKGVFFGENSWGNGWGIDGFYEIRPDVIGSKDSSDFVVIEAGFVPYSRP